MYFFTSDLHFDNEETLSLDNRPFKNTKQFDSFVIKQFNKQAKKEDTIFVVGDFVDCDGVESESWKKSLAYVKKINSNVVLIMGNNEDRVVKYFFDGDFDSFRKYCLDMGFQEVYKNLEINFSNINFYLVHKPIHYKSGIINLFGHMHRAGGLYKPFGLNIGCDLNHFRLYSQEDILNLLKMKDRYWDHDKNLNMKVE